jgi:hypothetical protein
VYRWNRTGVIESQHEVWGGVQGQAGADAVLVTHHDGELPAELAAAFETVERGETIVYHLGPTRTQSLQLWHGHNFRRWPKPIPSDTSREMLTPLVATQVKESVR